MWHLIFWPMGNLPDIDLFILYGRKMQYTTKTDNVGIISKRVITKVCQIDDRSVGFFLT